MSITAMDKRRQKKKKITNDTGGYYFVFLNLSISANNSVDIIKDTSWAYELNYLKHSDFQSV